VRWAEIDECRDRSGPSRIFFYMHGSARWGIAAVSAVVIACGTDGGSSDEDHDSSSGATAHDGSTTATDASASTTHDSTSGDPASTDATTDISTSTSTDTDTSSDGTESSTEGVDSSSGTTGAAGPCGDETQILWSSRSLGEVENENGTTSIGIVAWYDGADEFLEIADDFQIPEGDECWCVAAVVVTGFWSELTGPVPDYQVALYDDVDGLPAEDAAFAVVATPSTVEPVVIADYAWLDSERHTIELADLPTLSAGSHWMSATPLGPPFQDGFAQAFSTEDHANQSMKARAISAASPPCEEGWTDCDGTPYELGFEIHGAPVSCR